MYSTKEASEILGYKVRTIRGWILSGKLKAKKDAKTRRWKISKRELRKFAHDYKD